MGNAVAQFELDGQNPPISFWNFCSLSNAEYGVDNQNAVVAAGINPQRLPAVLIWAEYPDGRSAHYALVPDASASGSTLIPPEDIHDRIDRLWNGRFSSKSGILCTLVPQLCDIPAWLWLIAASYTTFESTTSDGKRRLVYGGAAAVLWIEFFQRGGFAWLKSKN